MSFDTQHEVAEAQEVTDRCDSSRKSYLVVLA